MMEENYSLYNDAPVIRTFTGKWMNVFEPTEEMIDIEDIAHALSNLCRFGGHTNQFYSVAQHSCHCYELAPHHIRLGALLHDASEAYLIDIPRPIKHKLLDYCVIEDSLMKVIAKKFGFAYPLDPIIKKIDNAMLKVEWDTFMIGAKQDVPHYKSAMAKQKFLHYFKTVAK